MEVQQEVAFAWAQQQVGTEIEAIVDAADPEVPGHALARSHADAPEIDCTVRVKGKNLRPGDLVRARVTGADGYDLIARALRVR
jgi:ribosomal protein S12 methylthiotransferase